MHSRSSSAPVVGGRRGHRPTRALRLAIHTHEPVAQPARRFATCTWPIGEPDDVQIRFVSDDALDTPEAIHHAAFGSNEEMTDLHGAMLPGMLALLIGRADHDIEIVA